ncbi:MAG: mandelate racemase/muconate lactonizing enzyme family protein [Chthoniobacteraceae bacterium]
MKIVALDVCPLTGATVDGGWPRGHEPQENLHTLLIVRTESGLVGHGSSFTSGTLTAGAVELLWPWLRGQSAVEPERVSETLRQSSFWQGRGGAVEHAISGIDIALWDLLGKATGQPVGRLLGGRYRERVQPYASLLMDEPAKLRDHLLAVKAQGFRAFKIGWGPFGRHNGATDEAIVRAAREAVGNDSRLMVDAGGSDAFWPNGYKWALNAAKMLADYDVHWFEEALAPDALEDYAKLRDHSPVPIAGGEVLARRQSFQPWLEARAFDIVQPDVTKVGGISEERRIAWMAQEHGVRFIPHGWNTAVGLAADLQLASAFHDTDLVEYLTGSPFIDEIAGGGWKLDADGMLAIPTKPGLGLELDPDAVKRYTNGEKLL